MVIMEKKGQKVINIKNFIYLAETVLIVAFFYFSIYPMAKEQIPEKIKEELTARKTLEEKEATTKKFDSIAKEYKSLSSQTSKIDEIISSSADLPKMLYLFQLLATNNGVAMEGISFGSVGDAKGEAGVSVLPATFRVNASYRVFKNYLDSLANNIPLIDVNSISFNTKEEGGIYSFSLEVNTYIEKIASEEEEEEEEDSNDDSEENID